jgi:hypothetical protein
MRAEWSMSEEELRGIILEELWTHRRKSPIMFDRALKGLLMPIEIKKSILKQLEGGGLIRYTFEPDTGLGNGDMTFKGIEVAEGTASPPFPIAIYQLIRTGGMRMENLSGVGRMNIGADQAQASQVERGGGFEWISKVWKAALKWLVTTQ